MVAAAASACSTALVQCSTRVGRPSETEWPVGHIAGGHHARNRNAARQDPAPLVAAHTVVEIDPRAGEPFGGRGHPDADHDEVGGDDAVVGQPHALDPGATDQSGDADPEAELHAVVDVQLTASPADGLADGPAERHGEGLDHGHVESEAMAGRGHFGADESGAHDGHPGLGPKGLADGQAVVEGAQQVHTSQLGKARQRAGMGAGRDDQTVVGQLAARVEHHPPALEVEPAGPGRQPELDAGAGIEAQLGSAGSMVPASTCLESGGRS